MVDLMYTNLCALVSADTGACQVILVLIACLQWIHCWTQTINCWELISSRSAITYGITVSTPEVHLCHVKLVRINNSS